MPSETWKRLQTASAHHLFGKTAPRSPLAAASVFHGVSVHRFQRNAQTAFLLKYCPDTRTRGVFIVPRHRPPNAQRVHIRPKRFRLFVIQHQLRRIGNGVVKAVFSKHIAQVVHIGKHHAAAFNAVFFQTAFQFGKSVAPEAGKNQQPVRLQGARPVVQHRKDLFRRQQSEIRPQHISTRFGQRRDRGLAVLHHALTRKPLPKTAFAGGSGSRQKIRTGIVFFKYRLRIAFRQQAAADVRIRTLQAGYTWARCGRVSGVSRHIRRDGGEPASICPADSCQTRSTKSRYSAANASAWLKNGVCAAFSITTSLLRFKSAVQILAHTRRRNRVFAAEHQQYRNIYLVEQMPRIRPFRRVQSFL